MGAAERKQGCVIQSETDGSEHERSIQEGCEGVEECPQI